jgi:hypothetical protein
MTDRSSAFRVVDEKWIEEEKRTLTHDQLLDEFFTRLERLDNAREAIESQAAQNGDARLRLRTEMLERFAQIQEDNGLIRLLLPDTSDPVHKLIDSAIDFLTQLQTVAEERPTLSPEMQVSLNTLVSALSITPALVRSALIGITWPLDDKLNILADLSRLRDIDINKPNNIKQVEDDQNEDDNENPNSPA